MKSNSDIRKESWGILSGRWFFRLLLVGLVLQTISLSVNGILSATFKALSITSLPDYLEAKLRHLQQGLDYSLPTAKAIYWMWASFGLQTFISYIFGAIVAFGFMKALLNAHANREDAWFSSAFGGFAKPLDVTALLFLQNLLVSLWSLLLLVPGIVALYRYRLAWFVKIEQPELSAYACLRQSTRLMRGYKAQAFLLDLSFLGWLLLSCSLLAGASVLGATANIVMAALGFLTGLAGFYLLVRTILGIAVSRAIFYRALPTEQTVTSETDAKSADAPGGTSIASSDAAQ